MQLSFLRVEDIDEEVKKLEARLNHSSVALAEEKKIVSTIAQLRTSRTYVAEYAARIGRMNEDEAARKGLVERIKVRRAGGPFLLAGGPSFWHAREH